MSAHKPEEEEKHKHVEEKGEKDLGVGEGEEKCAGTRRQQLPVVFR